MANSSLDFTDRAVLRPLAQLLAAVQAAAGQTPFLLMGAGARDLLLVHAHGVNPQRATEDTDLAMAVPSWDVFLAVRDALIASGDFKAEGPLHRLWFREQRLDIVPFGGVERADRCIARPPEGDEVMDVSGLAEALASAVHVRLPGGFSCLVASLPALALLKVWAWSRRMYTAPGKDATDLWMLLRHYADAGNQDRLFGHEGEDALASFEFDLDKAGAWLLGWDARGVLAGGSDSARLLEGLRKILGPEIDPDGPLRLVAQMPPGDRDRQLSLLTAFCEDLFEASLP
jgi:predicted nucleotidyltransferase